MEFKSSVLTKSKEDFTAGFGFETEHNSDANENRYNSHQLITVDV